MALRMPGRMWQRELTLDAVRTSTAHEAYGTGSAKLLLTTAHLDHTPEHCEESNLKAMAVKDVICITTASTMRQTAYRTRREGKAIDCF